MDIFGITNQEAAGAAAAGSFLGTTLAFFLVAVFIFYILIIVANWKIFEKAGEPGWKSIIPIYNIYIMFRIVNMESWFWWILGINLCASIMFVVDGFNPYATNTAEVQNFNFGAHPMTLIAALILFVTEIWAGITYAYRTSKVFGHGLGYTLGLIFLPNIFQLILGFGSSKYDKKALKK